MKLAERFTIDTVRDALVAPGHWHPYPTIADRRDWEGLSAEQKNFLIEEGEALLGTSWPELKATLFMEFQRNGNRSRYQAESYARRKMLIRLVMAECVENQGRFLDDIVNGIWAICEESFWDVPAHNRYTRYPESALPDTEFPIVALFSAETGSVLAFADYLLGEHLENHVPIVKERVQRELRDRLLDPYMERDDWNWLGFDRPPGSRAPNNWNPWIHSNLLTIELMIEQDEEQRAKFVHRALNGLDQFLSGYHEDGGCDEGISYWGRAGASIYECLDVLDTASRGRIAVWDEPLIKEIARYVLRTHIGGDWYVNFADGTAKTIPDPNVVYHYGERIEDEQLQTHAAASQADLTNEHTEFRSFNRTLNPYFRPIPQPETPPTYPLIKQSWLDGIQVLTAREAEGSSQGLFLAAKGGHNDESHNHNDVGSFIVGLDGQPVLIDAGVEEYTKKTFSDRRYEIWTMQSAYHNLPTVNGVQQAPGAEYHATDVSADIADDRAVLHLDIASAWPQEAGVQRWERTVQLLRGQDAKVTISDDYMLTSDPQSITLTLMSASHVDASTPGQLRLEGPKRALLVDYDVDIWQVETERIPVNDQRMSPVWGDCVTRILLHAKARTRSGSFSVTAHAG
ncbi:MAG TPA: heparinase II/III family protein [Thermomicrobiales bacterium]|nr:heparinase II/III family protein [Thermomicrobiales bacterium]